MIALFSETGGSTWKRRLAILSLAVDPFLACLKYVDMLC